MPKLDESFVYRPKIGEDMLAWCINLFSYHNGDPFRPDTWQAFYLKSNNRFLIANKSRRIGWSYITAVKGLAEAMDPAVNGYTKQFVSYSLEDATEKIRIATEFYDSIPQAQQPKKLVSRTRTHLEFLDRNGRSISRLISMPCRAPRGRGGSISLDEFAFHQKDEEIYTAALPIISRGGNLEIGSTPFGNKGKFYEIFIGKEKYDKYRRFNVPWYMSPALCRDVHAAIADTNLTTEQRVAKYGTEIVIDILKSLPIDDFEQEYQCSYRDDLAAFITLDMIRACTPVGDDEIVPYRNLDDFILAYQPETHGSLYAGYDVGRTNDKSELTILGYYPDENVRTVWCCVSLKGVRFEDQEKLLRRAITGLPLHRLAMDATGLGMDLAERMVGRYKRKVEGCTFTTEFKETISNSLWMVFDSRAIIMPADRDLQEQVHSIKKTVTVGKHARFDADRNSKNHADRYWSLALANYAVDSAPAKTRGQFYEQYEARRREGKLNVSNPNVVLNRIISNYQKKI